MRERIAKGSPLGQMECSLILQTARSAIVPCGDLEKDLRVAWDMVIKEDIAFMGYPDEDCQFRLGIGVCLMMLEDDSEQFEKLKRSLRGLQALHALIEGIPVDPGRISTDIYPLMQYWIDYKQS